MARDRTARWHRYWDKQAAHYDPVMRFWDRVLFRDSRNWACGEARGATLEVAIGTGLNLTEYPSDIELSGIDLSEEMLGKARERADELGRSVDLRQANAHALPFDDAVFDSVVCTFGLCAIPDVDAALDEMTRVLRPSGRMILVDHVRSSSRLVRGVQRIAELITVPLGGEHFLRRPLTLLRQRGLQIERSQRFTLGLVERLVARKPPG